MKSELFIEELLPPLNDDELMSSFHKMKNGDINSRNKIICHNIRLVLKEVYSLFLDNNYDKKDLVSIGLIGLIRAVDTYEANKGIFYTYAKKCIDNEILMFFRKMSSRPKCISMEEAISSNDDYFLTIKDHLKSDVDVESSYEEKEEKEIIRYIVQNLPEKEKLIVSLYYGFDEDICMSQQEIAQTLGLTQSYISIILKNVKKNVKNKLIREYDMKSITLRKVKKQG